MARLRGDMHMHTTVSDGRDPPQRVVLEAHRKGLDFIAVTDHDSFEGGLRARRAAEAMGLDIVVIVGNEVRTTRGDVLVYCPGERLPERVPRDPLELLDYMHSEGCLVVPAHPFDVRRKGIGSLVYKARWDAIEVFNAHSDPLSNRKAEQAARELGLPGLANSDAHVAEAVGSAYNLVEADEASDEAILEAVRRGRVTPVPGRPGVSVYASTLAWSIERRLRRRRGGGPSRLDYLEDLHSLEE
ncbi:MAG: PHP domain-containing protein [Crenarchaeota archaeon]|nr:PHP domain-containing protein [Thermoproteota archaeon]